MRLILGCLVVLWALFALPALCVAGVVLHPCDCGTECSHEENCLSDPCTDSQGRVVSRLVIEPPISVAVESGPSDAAAIAAASAPQATSSATLFQRYTERPRTLSALSSFHAASRFSLRN